MTDEDRAAHDDFTKGLIHDLAPEGAVETHLAQRIATDSWGGWSLLDEAVRPYPPMCLRKATPVVSAPAPSRTTSSPSANCGTAARPAPTSPKIDAALTTVHTFTLESKQLHLLTLYEQRINRSMQKNLAMLKQLQTTRKAEREAAMKEAVALLKLSEMRALEYQPEKDGFVFSRDQIHAAIDANTASNAPRQPISPLQAAQTPNASRLTRDNNPK